MGLGPHAVLQPRDKVGAAGGVVVGEVTCDNLLALGGPFGSVVSGVGAHGDFIGGYSYESDVSSSDRRGI